MSRIVNTRVIAKQEASLTRVLASRAAMAAMPARTTLAQRIKQTRELRGYTQAQLAKAAGVRQSTVGNLEAGIRTSTERVLELAAALRVRPDG